MGVWCAPVSGVWYVYVFLYSKQVKCVLWLLDFFYFVNRNILGENRKCFDNMELWICNIFVDFMVSAFVGLM